MAAIPADSVVMGSPESEKDRRNNEEPQYTVTFARGFAAQAVQDEDMECSLLKPFSMECGGMTPLFEPAA